MRIRILSLVVVLLMVSAVCSAGLWEQWEWLNPRPQGHTLDGLTASHTLVVAVGERGVILVSENGIDWDVVHSELGLILQDVTWTGDRFIAVGGHFVGTEFGIGTGVILTSPDGRDWTESYFVGGTMLNKVIVNSERILIVGYPGKTVTSADGVNWLVHELEDHPNSNIVDVAWNGSTYVGVSEPHFFGADRAIYLSDDGVSWTEASFGFGYISATLSSVVWDSERFLVFGGGRIVFSSTDGVIWTLMATDLDESMFAVIWTGDEYAGAGAGSQVARSIDGQSWSVDTVVFAAPGFLYDIVRFQGKYIVVGMDGAMAVSSEDGSDWTAVTSWEISPEFFINDISFADGVFVAVASIGRIFRSLDGLEWQQVAEFQPSLYSIQRFDDAFWVVGSDRLIAHSDDGQSWNIRNSDPGAEYEDIADNDEVIVAVGNRTGGPAVVATSTDGFAWAEIDIDGSDSLRISSVTWSGTRFVGVGSRQGAVFRSDDGYQWSFETLGSLLSLRRLVSNGSVLVAVGNEWGSGGVILVSKDNGVTWQMTYVDNRVDDVIWTGELFVAVGARIWSSRDGNHWTSEPVGFAVFPECVTGTEDEITVAGHDGLIMRAKRGRFNPPHHYHIMAEVE